MWRHPTHPGLPGYRIDAMTDKEKIRADARAEQVAL